MDKITIIIVAAGSGRRMQSNLAVGGRHCGQESEAGVDAKSESIELPKQFLSLRGVPILVHTFRRFRNTLPDGSIVVVLPEQWIGHWERIALEYNLGDHTICRGGESRFESVSNALEYVSDADYVGVHDGVRPLVPRNVIEQTLEMAQKTGAAIPALEVVDSYRRVVNGGDSVAVNREELRIVQTPQFFSREILVNSYSRGYRPEFTDDASVVEHAGIEVALSKGARENIKITTHLDITIAEAIIENID